MLDGQLSQVMTSFEKVRQALNNQVVQEVFSALLESLDYAFKIEKAIVDTEIELAQKEGDLQLWASSDSTQLNEEIVEVRLSVEAGRQKLKDLRQQKYTIQ